MNKDVYINPWIVVASTNVLHKFALKVMGGSELIWNSDDRFLKQLAADHNAALERERVKERAIPMGRAHHCCCKTPNFSVGDKSIEAWWHCLRCEGLVWAGRTEEPIWMFEWTPGVKNME